MGLEENKKREYLITIIQKYLDLSKEMMLYFKENANKDKKNEKICEHSIEKIEEAYSFIENINHFELLNYIFSMFVGSNYQAHAFVGSWITSEKIKEYDTDEGIEELRQIIKENKKKALEKEKRQKENLEAMKKAREQGKQIQMVWDKDTKTIKPVVIEEKPNA